MGLFDNDNKGFFDGLFDFNSDGKTSLDEEYLAYLMFQEFIKEEEEDESCIEPFDDSFFFTEEDSL